MQLTDNGGGDARLLLKNQNFDNIRSVKSPVTERITSPNLATAKSPNAVKVLNSETKSSSRKQIQGSLSYRHANGPNETTKRGSDSYRAQTANNAVRNSAYKVVEQQIIGSNQLYYQGQSQDVPHSRRLLVSNGTKTMAHQASVGVPGVTSGDQNKKRWHYGAQIVHQKEILVSDDDKGAEKRQQEEEQSETSYSLQPTPCAKNLSDSKRDSMQMQKPGPTPFGIPPNFLIRIDEQDEQTDGSKLPKKFAGQVFLDVASAQRSPRKYKASSAQMTIQQNPYNDLKPKEISPTKKRVKSKHIKKILKERLNIDCLKMLGEESDEDDKSPNKSIKDSEQTPQNMNDSFNVLMKEIGPPDAADDGLSMAFLQKNGGEVERQELNSFTDMFSVRDLLGVGAFGVVLNVKNRVTKEKSALKIIAKDKLSSRALKILKNESTIMQTMSHPGVVALKRIFENLKFIIIEMELIPGGQLKRLFKLRDAEGNPRPLTDLEASKVMKSLLNGVAYVHARDIVHRDLKPENILLSTEDDDCFEVKIVDFGLSAEQNWRLRLNEKAGTIIYMAPEQLSKKGYSKKVDLWACGIMAYQLLTCGQHPCYQKGETGYDKKLQNIETKPIEWSFTENFSPLAKDFFLNLVSYPPSQRYDAATALQHPWITRNESDKIPLSQQQELDNFQQERQLRKVMRLVYFGACVKMCQFQAQDPVSSHENNQEKYQETEENLSPQKQDSKTSEVVHVKNRVVKVVGGTSARNTIESEESQSPGLRFRRSRPMIISTKESGTFLPMPKKHSHNVFLKSDFAAYKELVLNQSKSAEISTSADSKANNKIEEKQRDLNAEYAFQKSDQEKQAIMEKNINNRRQQNNPQKKQKQQRRATKRQMTEQLGGITSLVQSNINFNPSKNGTNESHTPLIPNTMYHMNSNPRPMEKQSSLTYLNGPVPPKPIEVQNKVVAQMPNSTAASILVQNNYFKNQSDGLIPTSVSQTRPGRNLVPARSVLHSEQTNVLRSEDNQIGGILMAKGSTNISEIQAQSEFTTSQANNSPFKNTRTRFGGRHNYQRGIENTHSIDSPKLSAEPRGLIDKTQLEANRLKNNLTSIPVTKDTLVKNSTNVLYQATSKDVTLTHLPMSVSRDREGDDFEVEEVDTSTTQIFKSDSPRKYLNTNQNDSKAISSAASQYQPGLNRSNMMGGNIVEYQNQELGSMQQAMDRVLDMSIRQPKQPEDTAIQAITPKKPTTALQTNRNSAGKFGARKLIPGHNGSPHIEKEPIENPSLMGVERGLDLIKQTTQDSVKTDIIGQIVPKKVKKRVVHKRAQISATNNNLNSKSLAHQAAYKGYQGKSLAGEEQKIDWFQLIQAEKTVGGSRILQEQLQREQKEEQKMRKNSKVAALNSDYFMRQRNEEHQDASGYQQSHMIPSASLHRHGRPGRSPLVPLKSTQLSYPNVRQSSQPSDQVGGPQIGTNQMQHQYYYQFDNGTTNQQIQQYYSAKGGGSVNFTTDNLGKKQRSQQNTSSQNTNVRHSQQWSHASSSQGTSVVIHTNIMNNRAANLSPDLLVNSTSTPNNGLQGRPQKIVSSGGGARIQHKSKTSIKKINQHAAEMAVASAGNKKQFTGVASQHADSISSQPDGSDLNSGQKDSIVLFKRQQNSLRAFEPLGNAQEANSNNGVNQPQFYAFKSIAGLVGSNELNTLASAIAPSTEADMIGEGLKTYVINSPANEKTIVGIGEPPQKQKEELSSSILDLAPPLMSSGPPVAQSMVVQKAKSKKKIMHSNSQEQLILQQALNNNSKQVAKINPAPAQTNSNENLLTNRVGSSKGQIATFISNHSSDVSLPTFIKDAPVTATRPQNSKKEGKQKRQKVNRNKSNSTTAVVNYRFNEKHDSTTKLNAADHQQHPGQIVTGSGIKQGVVGGPIPIISSNGSSMGQTMEPNPHNSAFQGSNRQNNASYQRLFKCTQQSPVKINSNKLKAQKKNKNKNEDGLAALTEEPNRMKETNKAKAQKLTKANTNNSRTQRQIISGIGSKGFENISQPPVSHYIPLDSKNGTSQQPVTQQNMRRNQTNAFDSRVQSHQEFTISQVNHKQMLPKQTPRMIKRQINKGQGQGQAQGQGQSETNTFAIQGFQLGGGPI